jgi:hypothetical protein
MTCLDKDRAILVAMGTPVSELLPVVRDLFGTALPYDAQLTVGELAVVFSSWLPDGLCRDVAPQGALPAAFDLAMSSLSVYMRARRHEGELPEPDAELAMRALYATSDAPCPLTVASHCGGALLPVCTGQAASTHMS